jgi:hypothetical protein
MNSSDQLLQLLHHSNNGEKLKACQALIKTAFQLMKQDKDKIDIQVLENNKIKKDKTEQDSLKKENDGYNEPNNELNNDDDDDDDDEEEEGDEEVLNNINETNYSDNICDISKSSASRFEEIMMMVKLLCTTAINSSTNGEDITHEVIEYLLDNSNNGDLCILHPQVLLETVSDIAVLTSMKNTALILTIEKKIDLSEHLYKSMRSLMMQCLHGLAPEVVRDGALISFNDLISMNSFISPLWTIEPVSSNQTGSIPVPSYSTSNTPYPPRPPDSNASEDTSTRVRKEAVEERGQFAMLISAIISGELHLLIEEVSCQLTNQLTTTVIKRDVDIDRESRVFNMLILICTSVDSILYLLVGEPDNENYIEEEDDEVDSIWSILPADSLLHVRQSMHSSFQEMFDFYKLSTDIVNNHLNNYIEIKYNTASLTSEQTQLNQIKQKNFSSLLLIIQRLGMSLTKWVMEDLDLYTPFIDNLSNLLDSSIYFIIAKEKSRNNLSNNIDIYREDLLWNFLLQGIYMESSNSSSSSISNNSSNNRNQANNCKSSSYIDDFLPVILPCILQISENITDDFIKIDNICSNDSLIYVLISIITTVSNRIVNDTSLMTIDSYKNESTKSHIESLNRCCTTTSMAVDILIYMILWKENDLHTLSSSKEGPITAFTNIFPGSSVIDIQLMISSIQQANKIIAIKKFHKKSNKGKENKLLSPHFSLIYESFNKLYDLLQSTLLG